MRLDDIAYIPNDRKGFQVTGFIFALVGVTFLSFGIYQFIGQAEMSGLRRDEAGAIAAVLGAFGSLWSLIGAFFLTARGSIHILHDEVVVERSVFGRRWSKSLPVDDEGSVLLRSFTHSDDLTTIWLVEYAHPNGGVRLGQFETGTSGRTWARRLVAKLDVPFDDRVSGARAR